MTKALKRIMNELEDNYEFPLLGLLPKRETGIINFLTKYPEFNGVGTVIAIFDSGVDPGAPGLERTPNGKVKVLHRFDCSGCGDVTTTTKATPTDNVITGLTGRKLKIPSTWTNPTNVYRIGIKNAYELYPERLKERMKAEYKEKVWDVGQRRVEADVSREMIELELHNVTDSEPIEKMQKEDVEARSEIAAQLEKKFVDLGPVYDCVLFHDGEKWMCCVDTSEVGDLEKCTVLGEYSVTHDFAPLTKDDNLNYSINVHDNGDVLELVGLCSSHGTHVASIAAAYFPDCQQKNGAAPGAQIASFTIGDGRLGSMETGTALVRAIIKLIEINQVTPVQVINMSYGEFSHYCDCGRLGELINEVVNKYGIVWVASAGNHGPALSTIGTPPDLSQDIVIGVGAYVSPEMMLAAYSMRQKLPGMAFTWSSRGPCADGALGVSICAPGGAITSVPNFTLKGSQLMNGTSMAAPHVSGSICLLISGLIRSNISYSPYSIRRAIENTAFQLNTVEIFAQGNGLLQVDKAYEFLLNYSNAPESHVRFHIACGQSNTKGIYVRTKSSGSYSRNITVEPHFMDSDNVPAKTKINFNLKLALICTSTFVGCPMHLDMSHASRVFAIKIDPTLLSPGIHFAFIEAIDSSCVKKGPVFKIPVTVVIPEDVHIPKYSLSYDNITFKPNTIKRHFYNVPNFATWAVIKLTTNEQGSIGRFVIHSMQLLPRQSCTTLEMNKSFTVTATSETTHAFQVHANVTLEVTVAKYWANLGEVNLDYSITFSGTKPNNPQLTMYSADGIYNVDVTTLQGEEVLPNLTLKSSVQALKPVEAKVTPLTTRDLIPPNRQIYQLILVYNFSILKSTEVSPNLSLVSNVLYESEFESQMWMLFDTNKQFLGCGDAYPNKYTIKLEKGDYIIRAQIRHEKKDYLEKLLEAPLILQQKLANPITVDVYSHYVHALTGGKKAGVTSGLESMIVPLFIAPLAPDKYKSATPAQYLVGQVTYCKDELGKKVDVYPFKYILQESTGAIKKTGTSSTNTGNASSTSGEKLNYEDYSESIRDTMIQFLSRLDPESRSTLFSELSDSHSKYYPLYSAYLEVLDPLDAKHAFPSLEPIVLPFDAESQNILIETCLALAYHTYQFEIRVDPSKMKSALEQQKNSFVECLCRKGIIFCRLYYLEEEHRDELLESIDVIWLVIQKYIDINETKVLPNCVIFFIMWQSSINKHFGRWLKYALKLQEEKPSKELEEKLVVLYKLNGFHHVAQNILRNLPTKFPSTYKPF